jgi:pseudouridine-5'-phosphate glycosidase
MKIADNSKFIAGDEISFALERGDPVVALESTVITHGLPYPANLELALDMENIVRSSGAVPGTIAVLDGVIRIGLTERELGRLANEAGMLKIGARDLGIAVSKKWSGGTTVAGTIFCAFHAGIDVFATGGIGGVHRGKGVDISADLVQLSRAPVIVVCSGAKAILDLPATVEFLETYGVPVIGYRTFEFPAFYSVKSGIKLESSAGNVGEIAQIALQMRNLNSKSSLLVLNPPPAEFAVSCEEIEQAVNDSIRQAEKEGISGKEVTPYLLEKVAEKTSGESLAANLGLLKNNAKLAAEIAIAYRHIKKLN